jgi:hypothetical protein
MADIPRYDEWMRATALGITKPRSLSMRRVDSALEEFERHRNDPRERRRRLSALRLALNEWIKETGPRWKDSERNKAPDFPVTSLYDALQQQPVFTPEDLEAFRYQEEKRRLRIKQIFAGKKIVWQAFNAPDEARVHLAKVAMAAKGGVRTPASADVDAIRDFRAKQEAERIERATYKQGKYTGARDILNPLGSAALSIHTLAKRGNVLATAGEGTFGLAGTSATGPAFQHMLSDMFGGESFGTISNYLSQAIGANAMQVASSVTPIISNITSGASMLVAWGKAAKARYAEYETSTHSHAIASGDMEAAFRALTLLLDRQTTAATIQATIQTADFTTRTAMSFVDFGVASGSLIGAVSTLSKFMHKMYLLGREYAETRAARRLLADPGRLNASIFKTYPLLGCYMLVCSDLSEIICLARDQALQGGVPFGAEGWMDDVEQIKKKHIDPVLERACDVIYKSPFMVPNMPLHRLYKPDFIDTTGQKAGKARFAFNITRAVARGLTS